MLSPERCTYSWSVQRYASIMAAFMDILLACNQRITKEESITATPHQFFKEREILAFDPGTVPSGQGQGAHFEVGMHTSSFPSPCCPVPSIVHVRVAYQTQSSSVQFYSVEPHPVFCNCHRKKNSFFYYKSIHEKEIMNAWNFTKNREELSQPGGMEDISTPIACFACLIVNPYPYQGPEATEDTSCKSGKID